MHAVLLIHVFFGLLAIGAGGSALVFRKGAVSHRRSGRAFVGAMVAVSLLAIGLAIFPPSAHPPTTPSSASLSVALLSIYFAVSSWLTVRPIDAASGKLSRLTFGSGLALTLALSGLGTAAAATTSNGLRAFLPYFVFAVVAAIATAGDFQIVGRGPLTGANRVSRHLWRMCLALFFATAFFFVGQQQVMPMSWHGSPWLLVPAFAPLAVMAYWLFRLRRPWR